MKYRWMIAPMFGLGLLACDKQADPQGSASGESIVVVAPSKADETGTTVRNETTETVALAASKIEGVDQLVAKVDDAAAILGNADKAPLDATAYEKLILDHASCDITASGNIDSSCPAVKALQDARSGDQALAGLVGSETELGKKLLNHSSPAVRLKAAGLMGSMMGISVETQNTISQAVKSETHPGVLQALVRIIRNDFAGNPKVADALLFAADHADPAVRKEAIYALASTGDGETTAAIDKLITLMESDPDAEVRGTACKYAGDLGDARLIPAYRKLATTVIDPELLDACLQGVIKMWWSYPFHKNSNKDAYNLTLELLAKKPRAQRFPSSSALGELQNRSDEAFAKWKTNAPWFKETDLNKVFVEIVKDPNAGWMARTTAVDGLTKHGATNELKALLARFPEDVEGDDTHVRRSLAKALTPQE